VPSAASMRLTEKQKKYEEKGLAYLGPRHEDFNQCVSKSCGMTIETRAPVNVTPATTFGTLPHPLNSRVFIRKDEKELLETVQDFMEYQDRGSNENTLSALCKDSVVLRDRFIDSVPGGSHCRAACKKIASTCTVVKRHAG